MQGGGGGDASARLAGLYPELLLWLHQRHLEQVLNARIISAVETRLQERGYLEPGPRRLPAVAFVDLSGYTRLTEAAGDEAAVRSAVRLQELADAAARRGGGRLVKLLGDGALLYFDDTDRAVGATLELLDEIDRSELPAAHAGMQAGSVVLRDGDIYGRTVNLAARIVGAAAAGELVVGPGVVTEWTGSGIAFDSRGEVELKGIAAPVPLYRRGASNAGGGQPGTRSAEGGLCHDRAVSAETIQAAGRPGGGSTSSSWSGAWPSRAPAPRRSSSPGGSGWGRGIAARRDLKSGRPRRPVGRRSRSTPRAVRLARRAQARGRRSTPSRSTRPA